MSKPSAQTLSRLLVEKFPRLRMSKTMVKGAPMTHTGFEVKDPGLPDFVIVRWVLGENCRMTPDNRRLTLQQEKLAEIQEFLEARGYRVRRFSPATEISKWNQLTVFGKDTGPAGA